jgi:hypothetical protein
MKSKKDDANGLMRVAGCGPELLGVIGTVLLFFFGVQLIKAIV